MSEVSKVSEGFAKAESGAILRSEVQRVRPRREDTPEPKPSAEGLRPSRKCLDWWIVPASEGPGFDCQKPSSGSNLFDRTIERTLFALRVRAPSRV